MTRTPLTCLCFLLFVACNSGHDTAKTTEAFTPLSKADYTMLTEAYFNALLGVKLAEEGNTRCTTLECKQLAETILADHKKILMELQTIAGKHKADVPLDITDEQLKTWHLLVREKGIGFDKKFAEIIELEHAAAGRIFASIQSRASDPDLQKWSTAFLEYANLHKQDALTLTEVLNNRRSRDTMIIQHVSDEQ
jgi:predicted outer membrane protein